MMDLLETPESLLKKLSPGQKKLIEVLAANYPHGLLSSELTRETAVSNKSYLVDAKLRALLANSGLEINTERVSNQWLWKLKRIAIIKDNDGFIRNT